jgi:hypothetical protein
MNIAIRSAAVLAVALLAVGCSSDDKSATDTVAAGGDVTAAPVTDGGGDTGSGDTGGNVDGSLCDLAAADDLATLFPGGTIGEPDPTGGQQACSLTITGPAGTAYFSMTVSLLPYDDRLQNDTDLGFTISQLDGIGDRAYYSPGNETYPQADLVFEKAGSAYSMRATYTNSGLTMAAEPGLQDTMMRVGAAWAATL